MSLDPRFIQRWLDGECTEAEEAQMQELLASQPEVLSRLLTDSWETAAGVMPPDAAARLQASLQQQIKPRNNIRPLLRRLAVAAVLAGLLVGARWYFTRPALPHHVPAETIVWKTIINTHSNKVKITLPDSTQVWLSEQAQLQYAANFTERRQVKLSGEAFFAVAKGMHPFTLVAGSMHTEVLGTRFNVEAYMQEHMTRLSLVEGKVAVTYAHKRVVLQPGRSLTADAQGLHEEPVNTAFEAAWTGTGMVFNHLPLPDVLRRVGAHYGKRIVYTAPLENGQYFNSVLPANDLPAVLSNLSFVYKLHFTIKGDTLLVTPPVR